jgi:hypothetical protein
VEINCFSWIPVFTGMKVGGFTGFSRVVTFIRGGGKFHEKAFL